MNLIFEHPIFSFICLYVLCYTFLQTLDILFGSHNCEIKDERIDVGKE